MVGPELGEQRRQRGIDLGRRGGQLPLSRQHATARETGGGERRVRIAEALALRRERPLEQRRRLGGVAAVELDARCVAQRGSDAGVILAERRGERRHAARVLLRRRRAVARAPASQRPIGPHRQHLGMLGPERFDQGRLGLGEARVGGLPVAEIALQHAERVARARGLGVTGPEPRLADPERLAIGRVRRREVARLPVGLGAQQMHGGGRGIRRAEHLDVLLGRALEKGERLPRRAEPQREIAARLLQLAALLG